MNRFMDLLSTNDPFDSTDAWDLILEGIESIHNKKIITDAEEEILSERLGRFIDLAELAIKKVKKEVEKK